MSTITMTLELSIEQATDLAQSLERFVDDTLDDIPPGRECSRLEHRFFSLSDIALALREALKSAGVVKIDERTLSDIVHDMRTEA